MGYCCVAKNDDFMNFDEFIMKLMISLGDPFVTMLCDPIMELLRHLLVFDAHLWIFWKHISINGWENSKMKFTCLNIALKRNI